MNGERDDRFEGGGGTAGPGSFVLSVWITVAGLALLFAVVALVYGDPVREAAEQQAPRRQVAGGGATLLLGTPAEAGSVATPSSGRSDMVGATGRDAEILAELARVTTDNKALRNGVELLRGQVDSLSERLAKMESRFSEMTGSIGVPSSIVPTGRTPAPVTPAIEMGSATSADSKRTDTATYTQFGMELGSYSDLTTLRRAWSDLVRQYPALFEGLDGLATIRDRDGKAELLLVAGPFRNAADAAEHCGKVEGVGVKCLPAFYLGQQLSVH